MFYFIVNEKSQSGKCAELWQQLDSHLKQRQIEYECYVPQYEGHATKLASKICEADDDDIRIVVVGGDGTMNEVINGITDFEKVKLGIIPMGSGNDFARGMGFKGTAMQQLARILSCTETRDIDLGEVSWNGGKNLRRFIISSGVGLDALVCKKAFTSKVKKVLNRLHLGSLTYLVITIQSLFSMQTGNVEVVYDDNESVEYKDTIFMAAMNFKAEGGGVPMAPKAKADDGKFSVCLANGIKMPRIFVVLVALMLEKHSFFKGVHLTDCRRCAVKSDKPLVLHADGEYCADVTEAVFKCYEKKIHILI